MQKKKHPYFYVPNSAGKNYKGRVKTRWRKPRGIDNKKRVRKKSSGASPKVGYKNPKQLRFLHPSKLREIIIHNLSELDAVSKLKGIALRIAGSVGMKKKLEIFKKAESLKLRVLNKPNAPNQEQKKEKPKKAEEKR